uniref:SAP domain-containing protein n=1 Tax=viral metagenome TaxID=1070528 RepID=A0A6C0JT65_9ZZZZ
MSYICKNVAELKKILCDRGLDTSDGKKYDLIRRLVVDDYTSARGSIRRSPRLLQRTVSEQIKIPNNTPSKSTPPSKPTILPPSRTCYPEVELLEKFLKNATQEQVAILLKNRQRQMYIRKNAMWFSKTVLPVEPDLKIDYRLISSMFPLDFSISNQQQSKLEIEKLLAKNNGDLVQTVLDLQDGKY